MKNSLILLFSFISFIAQAQSDSAWQKVLVNPDLKIEFPLIPEKTLLNGQETYLLTYDSYAMEVVSEKTPLNYYGRTIKEVNDEYYGSLTKNVLNEGEKNRTLIRERNFKLDGFDVREIIFADSVESKPAKVTLWVLNVVGFKEACYKIKFVDFTFSETLPETGKKFFSSIDIYYSMEKKVSDSPGKEPAIFKDEGFIIDKKSKKKKR